MKDYAKLATQYAQDVVDGIIPNCKWVRFACQRHLDNLSASTSEDYPYRFDVGKAERVCAFISKLKHVRGKWANRNETIKLESWQVFILASLFGWVRKDSGLRRFREALIMVPRKNTKSTLAAGIGLYMLCCDNEAGAEVLNGATSLAQSMEVFRTAKQMCERSPEMVRALGIEVNAQSIVVPATGSRFTPVIGRPPDGASPSCGIGDEAHEWVTPDLYDTLKTGMMAREQPLLFIISTAGVNMASPCYALQEQAQKMLQGLEGFEDDQLFAIVFGLDVSDDWTTEAALKKANPNYGVSINPEIICRDQQTAVANSGKRNIFKCKNLNVWSQVKAGWMSMERWAATADRQLNEESFKGNDCYIGMDLASKIDLAAVVKVFPKQVDGKTHYYVVGRYYLPEAQAQQTQNQHYQQWVADEYIVATSGNVIDYGKILGDLVADSKSFRVRELGYDPYNATHISQQLNAETSVVTTEVPQTTRYLSEPMKQLEALVLDGRLHHDGNPAMTWMMSNVVALEDRNGNIQPHKGSDRDAKIDGAAALIIALSRALSQPAAQQYVPYQSIQFI